MKKSTPIQVMLLLPLGCVMSFIFLFDTFVFMPVKSLMAQSWVQTSGKLLKLEGGNHNISKLEYEFYVKDKAYFGSRFNFSFLNNEYDAKLTYLNGNADMIRVYYNPTNPQDSVLEPNYSYPVTFGTVMFAIMCVLATMVLFISVARFVKNFFANRVRAFL